MQIIESISSLLLGLWMLTGVTLSDGSSANLSFCQKKDFCQFHANGEMNMQMHGMENGGYQTDSEILPYHVTTDLTFIVMEPAGQKPMVMKVAQLEEELMVLEMGGGLVTFKKE